MDIKDKTTPTVENSTLLVVDMQERPSGNLRNDTIIQCCPKLITGAEILGVDVMITEQYPKGLFTIHRKPTYLPMFLFFEKDSFICMMQSERLMIIWKKRQSHPDFMGGKPYMCIKTV